jgi:hypothetical protein
VNVSELDFSGDLVNFVAFARPEIDLGNPIKESQEVLCRGLGFCDIWSEREKLPSDPSQRPVIYLSSRLRSENHSNENSEHLSKGVLPLPYKSTAIPKGECHGEEHNCLGKSKPYVGEDCHSECSMRWSIQ